MKKKARNDTDRLTATEEFCEHTDATDRRILKATTGEQCDHCIAKEIGISKKEMARRTKRLEGLGLLGTATGENGEAQRLDALAPMSRTPQHRGNAHAYIR
jgi:hypothetical protein